MSKKLDLDKPINPREARPRAHIWEKTGGKCWYCGEQTVPWKNFSVDHIVPVKHGGTDTDDNLVPSCRWCNTVKREKPLEYLRDQLRRKHSEFGSFSKEQIEKLHQHGFEVPFVPYEFYFEKEGIKP